MTCSNFMTKLRAIDCIYICMDPDERVKTQLLPGRHDVPHAICKGLFDIIGPLYPHPFLTDCFKQCLALSLMPLISEIFLVKAMLFDDNNGRPQSLGAWRQGFRSMVTPYMQTRWARLSTKTQS